MRTKDLLAAKPVSEVYTFKRAYMIESRCICTSQGKLCRFRHTFKDLRRDQSQCGNTATLVPGRSINSSKISYPRRGAAGVSKYSRELRMLHHAILVRFQCFGILFKWRET